MKNIFVFIAEFIGDTIGYIGKCLNNIYNDPYAGMLFMAMLIVLVISFFCVYRKKKQKRVLQSMGQEIEEAVETEFGGVVKRLLCKFLEEFLYLLSAAVMMIFKVIEVIQSYMMLFVDYFSGKMQSRTIAKIMTLAILALSVTSFFTTYQGMKSLVDSSLVRGLLTFGVQAILFASSIKIGENILRKSNGYTFANRIYTEKIYYVVFAVTLSISSFFSYNYFLDTLYTPEARYIDNFNKVKDVSYEILIDVDSKVSKYNNNIELKEKVTDYYDRLLQTINSENFGRKIFEIYNNKEKYDNLVNLIGDVNSAKDKDTVIAELEAIIVDYERNISQNNSLISELNNKITNNALQETGQNNGGLSSQISSLQKDNNSKRNEIAKVQTRIDTIRDSQNIEIDIEKSKIKFKEDTGYNLEEYESLLKSIDDKKSKLDNKSQYISKIVDLSNNINANDYANANNSEYLLAIKKYITEFNSAEINDIVKEYSSIEEYYNILKQRNSYLKLKEENINKLDEINVEFDENSDDKDKEKIYRDNVSELLTLVTETVVNAPVGQESEISNMAVSSNNDELSYKHDKLSKIRKIVRNTDSRLHAIEKNYRAIGRNFILAITSLLLAVIIDCAILFTGILIPKSSAALKPGMVNGIYTDEEAENMLRNIFSKPVFSKKKMEEEDEDNKE